MRTKKKMKEDIEFFNREWERLIKSKYDNEGINILTIFGVMDVALFFWSAIFSKPLAMFGSLIFLFLLMLMAGSK